MVGLQALDEHVISVGGRSLRRHLAALVVDAHERLTVRLGALADGLTSRRQPFIVYELPGVADVVRGKVERAPGDQGRVVRQTRKVQIGLDVCSRHARSGYIARLPRG